MLLAITQTLHALQHRLQGLRIETMNHLRTPDGFSAEKKAEVRMHLRRAIVDEWVHRQFLPTEAANDPEQAPSAA